MLVGCESRPYPAPDAQAFVHNAQAPALQSAAGGYSEGRVHITTENSVDHVLAVRVAHTRQQREQGLAGTPALPAGSGLLLVFPDLEHRGGITTDGVQIVLDMAFIDKNGEIVSIFTGNPCRSTPCTNYDPERPYHAVLQLPVNWLARHYVTKGDVVTWSYSEN